MLKKLREYRMTHLTNFRDENGYFPFLLKLKEDHDNLRRQKIMDLVFLRRYQKQSIQ